MPMTKKKPDSACRPKGRIALRSIRAALFLSAALFLLCPAASAESRKTLVYAASPFPPYSIIQDGEVTGIDLDLLRLIGEEMDFEVEPVAVTFQKSLEMMQTGQADATGSLQRRKDRESYMIYVEPPYNVESTKAFFLRAESPLEVQDYDDLEGLRIGVKKGVQYFFPFDLDKDLRKVPASSMRENIRRLLAGEIDIFTATLEEGIHWINKLGLAAEIRTAVYAYRGRVLSHFCISRKSPFASRVGKFGSILERLVRNGTLDRIRAFHLAPR